jgi:ATP-dependent RNA helicase RhlE
MKYSELNLDPRLNSAIEKLGYTEATAIQEQTIPHILEAKDVAGLAQTGTGKTAAFLIPLIERILKTETEPTSVRALKDWNARSFVLILVPTRELADQINDNVIKLTNGTNLKTYPLYGGTGYDKQKEALASGLQFVVSTPGRLMDLYKENFVDLKQVRAIVFDEADRMFDMGFKDDMTYILGRVPRERQFLVFSATLNFDVLNTAYQFGAEPVEINISRDQAKAENVKDFIIHLGHDEKPQYLLSMLKKENPKQAMIFTNFKHNVDRIAFFLMDNGIPAMGISSLLSQAQRNNVIEKFKAENDQNILVATDVAARGLDINGVDMVINYEMPQECESYVHRIGRTGRAGNEGKAFSFICDRDIDSLARVEDYTKKKIEAVFVEDADLVKEFKKFKHEDRSFGGKFDKPRSGGRSQGRGGNDRGDRRPRPPRREGGDAQSAAGPSGPARERKPHDGPRKQVDQKFNKTRDPQQNREPREQNRDKARDHKNFEKSARPHHQNGAKAAFKGHHDAKAQVQKTHKPDAQAQGKSARNFRSNSGSAKKSNAANAGLAQKVKSFIQKIFG